MSCSPHAHSPFRLHSLSLREHRLSKQLGTWPPNPSPTLFHCLFLTHAYLCCGLGEAPRKSSDSSVRCWLAPHPSRSKGRILAIFSSRRKGNWAIGKHRTRSQELDLLHRPAWYFPTWSSVLPTKDRPKDNRRPLNPKTFYPRTFQSGIMTPKTEDQNLLGN